MAFSYAYHRKQNWFHRWSSSVIVFKMLLSGCIIWWGNSSIYYKGSWDDFMVKSVHNISSPLKQYVFVICPPPNTHMTATTLSTPCQNETFKRNHRAACRTKDGVQSLISGGTVTIKCCGRLILSFFCPIIDRERRDYLKIHCGLLETLMVLSFFEPLLWRGFFVSLGGWGETYRPM